MLRLYLAEEVPGPSGWTDVAILEGNIAKVSEIGSVVINGENAV